MATFLRFEDIDAWKDGRILIREVYRVTRMKGFNKDFNLKDQLRRAACSITANIAEGFERGSNSEFIYFLSISKGSAGEIRSLIYTALDEGYIDQITFEQLYARSTQVIKKISGLISYLKKSNRKGPRYNRKP